MWVEVKSGAALELEVKLSDEEVKCSLGRNLRSNDVKAGRTRSNAAVVDWHILRQADLALGWSYLVGTPHQAPHPLNQTSLKHHDLHLARLRCFFFVYLVFLAFLVFLAIVNIPRWQHVSQELANMPRSRNDSCSGLFHHSSDNEARPDRFVFSSRDPPIAPDFFLA